MLTAMRDAGEIPERIFYGKIGRGGGARVRSWPEISPKDEAQGP